MLDQTCKHTTYMEGLRQESITREEPASGVDDTTYSGAYSSSALGVRMSTPLFGTGFNACIGAAAGLHMGLPKQ